MSISFIIYATIDIHFKEVRNNFFLTHDFIVRAFYSNGLIYERVIGFEKLPFDQMIIPQ